MKASTLELAVMIFLGTTVLVSTAIASRLTVGARASFEPSIGGGNFGVEHMDYFSDGVNQVKEGEDNWDATELPPNPMEMWLRPYSSPYGTELIHDARPGSSITEVDFWFSIVISSGTPGPGNVPYARGTINDSGGQFSGKVLTFQQQSLSEDVNEVYPVIDIRKAISRNSAMIPLYDPNGDNINMASLVDGSVYAKAKIRFTKRVADISNDGYVDASDLMYIANSWLYEGFADRADISGAKGIPDKRVDFYDFAEIASLWKVAKPIAVIVPHVVGLRQAEAEATILSARLTVGTISEALSGIYAAGYVISQDPTASNTVLAGIPVNFVVSMGGVTVPNVVGLSPAEAETAITSVGLVAVTAGDVFSDAIAEGYIASQNPPGGQPVVSGANVVIAASKGPGPLVVGWVYVSDPGIAGHEAFNGHVSRYETTNAQYCEYLNAALASGDITIIVNLVYGANGSNGGPDYEGMVYYDLGGAGYTYDGATDGGAARINLVGDVFEVDAGFETHPVTYVSWYGASAFCNYYGWRLPTEWEWQAVADYNDGRTYACGTLSNSVANYLGSNHPDGTTEAGAFGEYGYGLCDMTGNVYEWTSTSTSTSAVFRGGSWDDIPENCVVTTSRTQSKGHTAAMFGFRACTTLRALRTLNISSTLGGQVTIPGEGTFVHAVGTIVNVETQADPNYIFLKWSGTAVDWGMVGDPWASPTTVNVADSAVLVAEFVALSSVSVVPSVTGLSQAEAEAAIVSAGLTIGTIFDALSESVPAGYIISQYPAAGHVVQRNSTVDIVASRGPGIVVPDVVGLSQADANDAIVSAGLTVGDIMEVFSDTVPVGYVVSQAPFTGTKVPVGSAVDYVVSKGADASMVWISIVDSGVSGHEGFGGEMSKYETTNAQYCEFLNSAVASGDITISGSSVLGASGSNSGTDYVGQVYYNLGGVGASTDGATNGGAARINYGSGVFTVGSGFENHAVTYVSWYGATAFCNYYGYRLPTEWEWQAVADYDGGYAYGCGPSISNNTANYVGSSHPYGTTAVGAFGAYGYGMCDMAGNVFEWTASCWNGTDCGHMVIRGGGWYDSSSWCSVLAQNNEVPAQGYYGLGFRPCR